jgi:putative membrane protein
MKLSNEDHLRIANAVAAAERATSGEIRCVLAEGHDPVRLGLIAGCAALIVPALALLIGFQPEAIAARLSGWEAGHAGASAGGLAVYVSAQALVFAAVMLVGGAPLGRMLTPSPLRKALVHRAALAQFEALGLTRTRDATGVLLYVNLAHRQAEVLADSGIYAKAPTQVWDEVVGLLLDGVRRGDAADGFARAATRTGEILSAYLPPRDDDANELSDSVFVTH